MSYTTNYRAKVVRQIVLQDAADTLNIVAELLAGGTVDGVQTGFPATMTKKSPPPSRPGQPPNVRTGTLKRSFATRPAYTVGSRIVSSVGTNVRYAKDLEFGDPTRNLSARPFIERGVDLAQPYIDQRLKETPDRVSKAISARLPKP